MLHLCDVHDRRAFLGIGTLGLTSLARAGAPAARSGGRRPARGVIQLFLWGGPAQQETFDLKPAAPEGIRSLFRPIATRTPGTRICEHLPRLAGLSDRYALIRGLTHEGVNHGTSAYHMLTGRVHTTPGTLRHPTPDDHPSLGSVVTRFGKAPPHLPPAVSLPSVVYDGDGGEVPGQGPGMLGRRFGPFQVLGDPTRRDFSVDTLRLPAGVDRRRLAARHDLRAALEAKRQAPGSPPWRDMEAHFERAHGWLRSDAVSRAFRLAAEPERLRQRYGWDAFAQSCLLARRLVEAGVPLVTVYWNAPTNADDRSWDTHNDAPRRMRDHLLPSYDRAVSALLEDLEARGMLDGTLVVSVGEFGRTPKINRALGRDHWGFCQSALIAGAGVRGGQVYGSSDARAAYPTDRPVRPDDLAATALDVLGISPRLEIHDAQGRPHAICQGKRIAGLF
jgi:hypothetical protein